MADTAPLVRKLVATAPVQATAGTAQDTVIGEVPFAGTVTSATIIPEAGITGQATNYRSFRVVNAGGDGAGTTVVASLAFSSGAVTATKNDEKTITLSGTPANLLVAEGDVLVFDETVTGDGLASPGGLVQVEITRS